MSDTDPATPSRTRTWTSTLLSWRTRSTRRIAGSTRYNRPPPTRSLCHVRYRLLDAGTALCRVWYRHSVHGASVTRSVQDAGTDALPVLVEHQQRCLSLRFRQDPGQSKLPTSLNFASHQLC
eukprot:980540-Rhodomonas_salina.1